MKRRVSHLYLILVFSSFLFLTERSLQAKVHLPSDVLSASEIRSLISGHTAEVAIVKAKGTGLFYFSPDGEFRQLIDNWLEVGHWKVDKRDRLCISIAEGRWKCRLLIRNMKDISQYVVKKDGNHRRELTYENFNYGNKLLAHTQSSSNFLEKLTKEEIVMLFTDKTVESETVRKGRVSLTYYRSNGTLELFRNGKKHSGAWRVTENNRMCLRIENSKEKCRIIVKQGASFSKYIVKKNGQHQRSINYRRFLPGKQF
ncbi:MAG: hypothetical protein GY799_27805 [Desulfobulbaceae bacterium]|nr:hypothetical protein [Desulfobulbaceae bacterium]